MHVMWYIDIALAVVQALITVLIIRNYASIGFKGLGKLLISLSIMLLIESLFMTTVYYVWAINDMGMLISLPALMITLFNVVAVFILYLISRM
ncbi:MAG: hypothetical protein ACP5L5_02295 [Vulcanisaeta sp.]|uniref:hypothetical protein n=1 Tax=Vulcanisaeta sp. TaxID=2020871 RepID=UPI003D0B3BE6